MLLQIDSFPTSSFVQAFGRWTARPLASLACRAQVMQCWLRRDEIALLIANVALPPARAFLAYTPARTHRLFHHRLQKVDLQLEGSERLSSSSSSPSHTHRAIERSHRMPPCNRPIGLHDARERFHLKPAGRRDSTMRNRSVCPTGEEMLAGNVLRPISTKGVSLFQFPYLGRGPPAKVADQ